ncbi:hypothetical protein O181_079938 [Austropuccinia psidii MF-1]|uniref:Uncharacterized protein n=1 Tax=Austropuccinia psidii MF-1 TaxID=1389203 RepID=A0A9Q3FLY9_9BASI|nr:hypothetical protein [Austropuccinia psidii MF-1]
MMSQIQEPKYPWEIVHMDLVTASPQVGDRSFNSFLVLVGRYRKSPMFLPFHKYDTAMDTADKCIILNSLPLSNRWFSTNNDKELEEILRRFCACVIELKDFDGFTHYLCNLIPALDLAYKTSIHYSTGKTPEILEKGWNPILTHDTLKKDLVDIHLIARSFKIILHKERHHANRCMQDSFKYAKEIWEKSYKPPDFKVGDLFLVSTLKFNDIKGPNKLKDSLAGPFMIRELHGPNSVQLELKGE